MKDYFCNLLNIELYKNPKTRTVAMSNLSIWINVIMALIKFVISIYAMSSFMLMNALISVGICLAHFFVAKGFRAGNDETVQFHYYRIIGYVLLIFSIAYTAFFSASSVMDVQFASYSLILSLVIALFSFVELVLSIRGIVKERKTQNPLFKAVNLINLVTAFTSLVLTQVALMSLAENWDFTNLYHGYAGMLFGSCSVMVGIYMLAHIRKLKKHNNCIQFSE